MDNFYMHLPSNSSMKHYFPNNKTSSYTVKLPQTFNFKNENWEVGLAEILFPNDWHNVREPFNYVEYSTDIGGGGSDGGAWSRYEFKPAWYDITDLLLEISEKIFTAEQSQKYSFKYDSKLKRIIFRGHPSNKGALYFNKTLGHMLGYGGEYRCMLNGERKSPVPAPKMCNAYYSTPKYLYIYTDIVENQIVGGDKYCLLRNVNVGEQIHKTSRGETISRIYDTVFYIPLKSEEFDTIEVNIRQEGGGELAPFASGIVTISLHFRKHGGRILS